MLKAQITNVKEGFITCSLTSIKNSDL